MFKTLMTTALEGAKFNFRTFGYLEQVLMAITRKGPIISSLMWKTDTEKAKVIQNCVKKIAYMRCLMYVFVGEAKVSRFKLSNLSSRTIQELK